MAVELVFLKQPVKKQGTFAVSTGAAGNTEKPDLRVIPGANQQGFHLLPFLNRERACCKPPEDRLPGRCKNSTFIQKTKYVVSLPVPSMFGSCQRKNLQPQHSCIAWKRLRGRSLLPEEDR